MDNNLYKVNKGNFGEEVVLNELKNIFNGDALFFRNVLIPSKNNSDKCFECDIICVSCKGIFVFEVKNWTGHIEANMLSPKWGFKSKGNINFDQYDNPIMQNEIHRNVLSDLLGEQVVSIVVLNDIGNKFSIRRYSEELVKVPVLLTSELKTFFSKNYHNDVYSNQEFYSLYSKITNMENNSNKIKNEKLKLNEERILPDNNQVSKNNGHQADINKNSNNSFKPSLITNNGKSKNSIKNYNIGDSIKHKTFGNGIVISSENIGNTVFLNVEFENVGTKRIISNEDYIEQNSNSKNKIIQTNRSVKRKTSYLKRIAIVFACAFVALLLVNIVSNNNTVQSLKTLFESQNDIPEVIKYRHQYTIEELSKMPVVKNKNDEDVKIKLGQSLLYKTVKETYVSNYKNKTRTAKVYITPVEYLNEKDSQEYYDYLSKKYNYKRQLRVADNERYVVVRMYVWYQNKRIQSIEFNKEQYKESLYRSNELIEFCVEDNSDYYWSNETNNKEFISGLFIEDFNNSSVQKNNTISSGIPVEVLYLIPISKDLKYTIYINPNGGINGTDEAILKLSK